MCSDLLHLLKHAHLSPALPPLFTFCPPLRPLPSKSDGFIYFGLSHNPVTRSAWPLLLFQPLFCWAWPDLARTCLCSFFTFISSVSPPNSPHPFVFSSLSLLPVNTSLSLICISWSLAHLSLPFYPPSNLALLLSLCISFYHLLTWTFLI